MMLARRAVVLSVTDHDIAFFARHISRFQLCVVWAKADSVDQCLLFK